MGRGRVSHEVRDRIIELGAGDSSIEEIANKTGASEKQVTSILKQYASEASEGEEQVSEVDWRQRYLDAHALLVENNLA